MGWSLTLAVLPGSPPASRELGPHGKFVTGGRHTLAAVYVTNAILWTAVDFIITAHGLRTKPVN